MNEKPLVSVVVPMYNVEVFLQECVESIRAQSLENIEIVLVDDGSPDSCGAIADEYAARDGRVKVVRRENGGLGPARNSGIDAATGDYVGFVDSDDWVDPDMYERLYLAAESARAQIAYTGLKTVKGGMADIVQEHPFAGRVLRGRDEIFELRRAFYGVSPLRIKDESTPVSVCPALFKRSFLDEHGLRFVNVRSEDKFFNTAACRKAETISCIYGTPYSYRKDGQPSITKTFDRKTIDSFFRLFRLLEQFADEEPDDCWDECHVRANRCVIDYCRVLIGMIEESSEEDGCKHRFVAEVCNHPTLRRACKGYPFWKLPMQQMVFFLCLRLKLDGAARCLTHLKRR